MSILGLSRWNKNWNVRNSYSYVATANKIRFHFQFPRLPDAEFGGLIGWLFNWKCKFSCGIISKIANYLKYNYFWDGDGIENVTSRLWKFSDFCSRHTVGVAGDDIMFHILVLTCIWYGMWCAYLAIAFGVCYYSGLTHWGRLTQICVSKLTIIGSDNGLSPGRRQAIIWTNAAILSIGALGTNFSEILIKICTFSLKKMLLKMPSGKRRPSCLGLDVLSIWSRSGVYGTFHMHTYMVYI